jgi:exonuclease III
MMKIITWNIRGLNGRSKQRILRNCVKSEDPDILLLQETKCAGIWQKKHSKDVGGIVTSPTQTPKGQQGVYLSSGTQPQLFWNQPSQQ